MPEKIKGKRRRGQQRMRWLDSTTGSVDVNCEQSQGEQCVGSQRVRHDLETEQRKLV